MTGIPGGKPAAPAPEVAPAAAQPATARPAVPRHWQPLVAVTRPGEIDITPDGQVRDTQPRAQAVVNGRIPQLGTWHSRGALRIAVMRDPRGLALGGDIDEETYPALVEALDRIPPDHASLHVDLSAVTFCDLPGLRAIVRLADTSTPVILHGVPRPLRTVMKILGWDQEPGLVISKCQHGTPGRGGLWADPPAVRPAHLP
jgi:ABC-type transporter Mla MlaB component